MQQIIYAFSGNSVTYQQHSGMTGIINDNTGTVLLFECGKFFPVAIQMHHCRIQIHAGNCVAAVFGGLDRKSVV